MVLLPGVRGQDKAEATVPNFDNIDITSLEMEPRAEPVRMARPESMTLDETAPAEFGDDKADGPVLDEKEMAESYEKEWRTK